MSRLFRWRRQPRPKPTPAPKPQPTPKPQPQPQPKPEGRTRGERMGVWITAPSAADVDTVAGLGVRWLGIGPEDGWGTIVPIIDHAHGVGLRVIISTQHSGHDYSGIVANHGALTTYAAWCAAWVDRGADAIALLNEPNNATFWQPQPDPSMAGPATVCNAAIRAIRQRSQTIPIVTPGWSPAGGELAPPVAQSRFANALQTAGWTHCGHHPYVSWDPINGKPADPWNYGWVDDGKIRATNGTHAWNPFRQTSDVSAAAHDAPVWVTEHGETSDGPWTDQQHADHIDAYEMAFDRLRDSGCPVDVWMRFSLHDTGDTIGLVRPDGTERPAAARYRAWAARPG